MTFAASFAITVEPRIARWEPAGWDRTINVSSTRGGSFAASKAFDFVTAPFPCRAGARPSRRLWQVGG